MGGRVFRLLALCPALVVHGTAAQVPSLQPPAGQSAGNLSRYEGLYGQPEFRTLEGTGPWPECTAIRTIGRLEYIPRRPDGHASPAPGGGASQDNAQAYQLCEGQVCLALIPVEELRGSFPGAGWVGQRLSVVGAIDSVGSARGFLIWSASVAPERATRSEGEGSTLEPLIRYPEAAAGRIVTATGTFRGANLFEDLPPESRRRPGLGAAGRPVLDLGHEQGPAGQGLVSRSAVEGRLLLACFRYRYRRDGERLRLPPCVERGAGLEGAGG